MRSFVQFYFFTISCCTLIRKSIDSLLSAFSQYFFKQKQMLSFRVLFIRNLRSIPNSAILEEMQKIEGYFFHVLEVDFVFNFNKAITGAQFCPILFFQFLDFIFLE